MVINHILLIFKIALYRNRELGSCSLTYIINKILLIKETEENNVWAFAYNPNHFAGLQVLFQALMNKNTIIFIFDKDFGDIPDILKVNNVTHISCTPTFMKMLIPHMYNIDGT